MSNRIGIYFASHHGQTRAIAERIGQRLANVGCDVTITNIESDATTRPGLHELDAVLIGAPLYLQRYPVQVRRFLERKRYELARHSSTGFFSVSLSQSLAPLREILKRIAWQPDWIANFRGALAYRSYGPLTRWIMRRISAKEGGPTDTSRDHDLTSWDDVDRFADEIAAKVVKQETTC
jgi:menaquinone-dependent protoporphyrinogen oxidase